jgi:hypothetical protein
MVDKTSWNLAKSATVCFVWKLERKAAKSYCIYMMTLTSCSTVLVLNYAAPVAKVLSHTDKKEN